MVKKVKNLFRENIMPIVGAVVIITTRPVFADVLENKSSNFDSVLSQMGTGAEERSKSDFAAKIREQRDKSATKEEATIAKKSSGKSVNKCDQSLRECMKEKCGKNFEQCYTDNETIWGDKLDSCRRNTECTGHEYAILAPEIAADRDFNIRMSVYQDIIDCGKEYNACIFTNCGTTLDNCIAKSDGDAVIEKCKEIADKCKEQDSGMAGRAMEVFGTLRQHAIAQAREDEERLYKLRETMEAACKSKGAMFDQRSLVCVYTVNFFAGDQPEHPMASKKLYAGGTFQCTPEWFGIDVTTFKENAYRLTRSEKAASSAALGAGLGTAASTFTSGQIQQAIQEKGVSWKPGEKGKSIDQIKQEREANKDQRQKAREAKKDDREKEKAKAQKEKNEKKDADAKKKVEEKKQKEAEKEANMTEAQKAKKELKDAKNDLKNAKKAKAEEEKIKAEAEKNKKKADEAKKKEDEKKAKDKEKADNIRAKVEKAKNEADELRKTDAQKKAELEAEAQQMTEVMQSLDDIENKLGL